MTDRDGPAPPTPVTGQNRVRLFANLLAASVVTFATVAAFVPAFLDIQVTEIATVLSLLVYASAAVLALLMAAGPALASRIGAGRSDGMGKIVIMALTEGSGALGVLAAGLVRQTAWVIALAVAAIFVLFRVATSD